MGGPREGGVGGCEMTFGGADAEVRLPGIARGLGDGPGLGSITSGVNDRLMGADGCCEPGARGVFSLTFLTVSRACRYAWIKTRHAPDIDWIAERNKMANDCRENP